MLTAERLRELLHYDPSTGAWHWRVNRRGKRARAGDVAGYRLQIGYWFICVERERYYGHRLAWLYMTGRWPRNQIDHIDHNPSNDRWSNLREATQSQNNMNQRGRQRGVGLMPWGRWRARIHKDGAEINLGSFATQEAARAAYQIAARKLYGEFAP